MKHKLHVDSVFKNIKGKTILNNAMLQLQTGEIAGLLGRNGSGKSTLLKIIFGTMAADDKFVIIDNSDIRPFNNDIAYLPQHSFLPPSFSVKKAVQLFLADGAADAFYNDPNIASLTDKKVHQLSGGELRYLEVKLLLCSTAKFVLLDEPFTELSPLVLENLKQEIVKCSAHKGILISDHKNYDVTDIVNKLYLLKDGKALIIDDTKELAGLGYLNEGMA